MECLVIMENGMKDLKNGLEKTLTTISKQLEINQDKLKQRQGYIFH